ncbi:MAG: hypothetical protein PHE09_18630 [Oscillospiraceae bacterium]|nr:hypothetical protein [Oscillospiraceae bacterium]
MDVISTVPLGISVKIQIAFYAGWPKAWATFYMAKKSTQANDTSKNITCVNFKMQPCHNRVGGDALIF